MASTRGIPLSKVSPAFLHANSTSHTWIFSAFAELIDNAYDPDVSASELLIDKVDIHGVPCLIFLDNGAGIDTDHLIKMLSFGFCEKDIYEKQGSHQPIGHYGNGFKSGSMRIGNDALVFTRCQKSASIGFLSQTYLKAIQTDSVMIPILEYRLPSLERIKSQESRNNLDAILEYSVFKTENELKDELKALEGSKTGTKIIINTLKRLQDGTYELDFSSDPTDIRCPEAHEADMTSVYHRPIQHNSAEYKRSLREYCSILFLRPRMKITIRGVRVKSRLISKSLSNTEIDMYKPTWLSRPVKIIFGFTCETQRPEDCDYGMMLYHRNRLIKAFEKVGYQKQPNGLGIGVVGVAQVDFLQPIHNKQDFNKDEKFNSVMSAFANKLNDYWNEKKGTDSNVSQQPVVRNHPDWMWAQCDHCLKWRRLPDEIDPNSLSELWYCRMNPDATHNRCDIPEEPEDEDLAVKPTYEKTFKKKQEERKRLQQMEKEKEEDMKRRKIMEKEQELKEKEATLRAIQEVAAAKPLQERGTVMSLQKALAEARRREEQQKRLILQIQEQKKIMEEERNSLLQIATSLKATEGNTNEEVLQQMTQFLSTLNPQSVVPSPVSRKRKSAEESLHTPSSKDRKKMSIKTESGELLSVTENEIDAGDEDLGADHSSPSPSPNQSNTLHQNSHSAENETGKKSSTIPLPRQQDTSLPLTSSSKTPSRRSIRQTSIATPSESVTEASSPQRDSSKSARKRQRKGTVVAVIDLTNDNEFGELIDVKPSLDELRTTLQDSLQYDVKPDKDTLDEALSINDDHVKDKEADPTLKEEVIEAVPQNTTFLPSIEGSGPNTSNAAASDNRESDRSSGIKFGPSEDDPEFMMGIPDSFHDNLEAAMAAIQDKLEKTSKKRTVFKDEVREVTVSASALKDKNNFSEIVEMGHENTDDGSKKNKNKENKNTSVTVTLKDLLPLEDDDECDSPIDDNSDYRDYPAVDEKGNTCEPHIGRQKCNGISETGRSNSREESGESSHYCIDTDGESSATPESPDDISIQQQKCGKMIDSLDEECNSVNSLVDEPNSANSTESSSKRCFKNGKKRDYSIKEGNCKSTSINRLVKGRMHPSKHNDEQESDVTSSEGTLTEVLSLWKVPDQSPSSENPDLSTSCLTSEFSAKKGTTVGRCSRNIKDSVQTHEIEDTLESGDKTLFSKSERTCGEYMQTDRDMVTVKETIRPRDRLLVKMFHHQDINNKKRLSAEREKTDKTFQAPDLKNYSEAAVQTEVCSSPEDLETLTELQIKLSLKTQHLEKMKETLNETHVNLHKLLGFIVPGRDFGDVSNIGEFIKNLIQPGEESSQYIKNLIQPSEESSQSSQGSSSVP